MLALTILTLAGCDLPDGPATPAPSGISAIGNNGDTRVGGADQPFSARGSEKVISIAQ